MRVVVHDYAGHPFPVQLSRELAKRGHQVLHLYAGYNQTPRGALELQNDDPPSLDIRGVFIGEPLDKDSYLKRWSQEREYGRLAAASMRQFRPQTVISGNTPLDAQARLLSECRAQGVRFVYWLQDFLGFGARSILRRRLPVLGGLIGAYHMRLERSLLKAPDAIVAITEDFCPTLRAWGIPAAKTEVIPNWGPLEELPVCAKDNPWSRAQGLNTGFTFLYTGTLRMKHNPALLLELAKRLCQGAGSTSLVVASEGPGASWLKNQAFQLGLSNVRVLGFQPMAQYAQVLGAADVLTAILNAEAGVFSVPSKVLSYLCAKRPVLLSVPGANQAARIVNDHMTGIVVDPDDLEGYIRAARSLMASPPLRRQMGENARKYAQANFDIRAIADRFEGLISRL